MANFSTDSDLTVYQPDILGFGIASFTSPTDYHAFARADIERDLRIRWWPVYVKQTYRDISFLINYACVDNVNAPVPVNVNSASTNPSNDADIL